MVRHCYFNFLIVLLKQLVICRCVLLQTV